MKQEVEHLGKAKWVTETVYSEWWSTLCHNSYPFPLDINEQKFINNDDRISKLEKENRQLKRKYCEHDKIIAKLHHKLEQITSGINDHSDNTKFKAKCKINKDTRLKITINKAALCNISTLPSDKSISEFTESETKERIPEVTKTKSYIHQLRENLSKAGCNVKKQSQGSSHSDSQNMKEKWENTLKDIFDDDKENNHNNKESESSSRVTFDPQKVEKRLKTGGSQSLKVVWDPKIALQANTNKAKKRYTSHNP